MTLNLSIDPKLNPTLDPNSTSNPNPNPSPKRNPNPTLTLTHFLTLARP